MLAYLLASLLSVASPPDSISMCGWVCPANRCVYTQGGCSTDIETGAELCWWYWTCVGELQGGGR